MPDEYRIRDDRHLLDDVKPDEVLARVLADVVDLLAIDPFNDPPWNGLSVRPYPDPSLPGCWTVALGEYGFLLFRVDRFARLIELLALVRV